MTCTHVIGLIDAVDFDGAAVCAVCAVHEANEFYAP